MHNKELPRPYWVDMASRDFAALPPDTVAVMPVAAIEQHGPHLPVYVDACLNQGIVGRVIARMPAGLPVTFLPMLPIGKSNEHLAFPGTLTLSAETLIRVWTEIGESVHRAGIRKLVILNSHGGQPQIMQIVARDLRVRLSMLVVCANTYGFGADASDFPEQEQVHGIHAGAIETSMMLALRPDLVEMELAAHFVPASVAMQEEYRHLAAEGTVSFGWQIQDLHPSGACGNALNADAVRGEAVIDRATEGVLALLREVHRYPLESIRNIA